ncbi:MAG: rod-determining factor RdfA [Halobacteriaceae archaeon]
MGEHKMERVIDEYGLAGLGDELEARWTGAAGERTSLRALADETNREILRAALNAAATDVVEGDVETFYERLTDDDVLRATRNQTRRRLEAEGVPVEAVERDFVSHQTVYTYLTDVRGASLDDVDDEDQVEKVDERIQRLRGRLETVTRNELETLSNTDRIVLGDADVLSSVRVLCRTCGGDYEVSELLEEGGCDCGR